MVFIAIHDMCDTHYIVFYQKNNWLLFFGGGGNTKETADRKCNGCRAYHE